MNEWWKEKTTVLTQKDKNKLAQIISKVEHKLSKFAPIDKRDTRYIDGIIECLQILKTIDNNVLLNEFIRYINPPLVIMTIKDKFWDVIMNDKYIDNQYKDNIKNKILNTPKLERHLEYLLEYADAGDFNEYIFYSNSKSQNAGMKKLERVINEYEKEGILQYFDIYFQDHKKRDYKDICKRIKAIMNTEPNPFPIGKFDKIRGYKPLKATKYNEHFYFVSTK